MWPRPIDGKHEHIAKRLQLADNDKPAYLRFQQLIVERQDTAEARAEDMGWFVSDRSAVDALVYSQYMGGANADETAILLNSKAMQRCLHRYRRSLVFVVHPLPGARVDDNVRLLRGLDSDVFTQRIQQMLTEENITYVDLYESDAQHRVTFVENKLAGFRPFAMRSASATAATPEAKYRSEPGVIEKVSRSKGAKRSLELTPNRE